MSYFIPIHEKQSRVAFAIISHTSSLIMPAVTKITKKTKSEIFIVNFSFGFFINIDSIL